MVWISLVQTKQCTSIVVSIVYILRCFTKRNFIRFDTHVSEFKVLVNDWFPLQCVRQFRVILIRIQVSISSLFASRRAAAWHIIRRGLRTFLESAHHWDILVQEYSSCLLVYHPSATVKSETIFRCSKGLPHCVLSPVKYKVCVTHNMKLDMTV